MPLHLRPTGARGARTAGLLAVTVLLAGTAACASPSSSAADPGCVVLGGLKEKQVGEVDTSQTGSRPEGRPPALGDSTAYVRHLYGAGAKPAATVYGTSHVRRHLPGGHLLGYLDERIELADGTVQAQGFYDLTAAHAGRTQHVPTVGLTGSFRDKMGRRTFRTPRNGGTSSAAIEMCPAGMLK
jgi:hypothetical protein